MVKDKYYNKGIEKQRLELARQSFNIKYKSSAPKEHKEIAHRLISEQKQRVSYEEGIKKQENKVYEHSVRGKLSKGLVNLANKYNSSLNQKVMNKRILKTQPRATVVIKQINSPDVLNDSNRFFKSNFQNEKRNMFLE